MNIFIFTTVLLKTTITCSFNANYIEVEICFSTLTMGTEDISEELFYLNTDKTDNMRGFQHAYSL